jgi:hypothetical protein
MLDAINGTTIFTDQLNGGYIGSDEGVKLKTTYTLQDPGLPDGAPLDDAWIPSLPENRGTNQTGFSAIPAGCKYTDRVALGAVGAGTCFPSSSGAIGGGTIWWRCIYYHSPGVNRSGYWRSVGQSVRCLRDS